MVDDTYLNVLQVLRREEDDLPIQRTTYLTFAKETALKRLHPARSGSRVYNQAQAAG